MIVYGEFLKWGVFKMPGRRIVAVVRDKEHACIVASQFSGTEGCSYAAMPLDHFEREYCKPFRDPKKTRKRA